MDILVLGGSFGGMTAAYELRRQLQPGDARIVVIAKDPRFTFIPSLPWVAMGWRKMDAISFELDRPLARKEIEFVAATVEKIDPDRRTVSAGGHEYGYERLVIATHGNDGMNVKRGSLAMTTTRASPGCSCRRSS